MTKKLVYWLALGIAAIAQSTSLPVTCAQSLPDATAQHLPRWRGFNLLEKFYRHGDANGPFLESDFRLIHELGFNFVRLPMDYRVWIKDDDWNQFDEAQLRHIDQAVAWGKKYSIHVCINFHRAPGYTVAKPPEATDLWTDPVAQRVCAQHWAMFAKRYRGIPNQQLSFNLFNEPSDVSKAAYLNVVRQDRSGDSRRGPAAVDDFGWPRVGPGADSRTCETSDRAGNTRLHADGHHSLQGLLGERCGSVSGSDLAAIDGQSAGCMHRANRECPPRHDDRWSWKQHSIVPHPCACV